MSDNNWIGDFHKALEQRGAPKAESYPLKPQDIRDVLKTFPTKTGNGTPIQPVSDWVKRMGGTIGPKPDGMDNGPASILRAQITAVDWPWRIIKQGKR